MKKILTVCVSALAGAMLMTGCNKQVVDLTQLLVGAAENA